MEVTALPVVPGAPPVDSRFELRAGFARAAGRAVSTVMILPLFSACATTAYTPPVPVNEADQRACDQFARLEASALFTSTSEQVKRTLADSARFPPLLLIAPLLVPLTVLSNRDNQQKHEAIYEAAMKACLEPVVLAHTLGPDHPDLARSLDRLAQLYAFRGRQEEAAALYRRALAIQEKALGSDSPDLATTLEHYAALLREMKRATEAADLESRAKGIRARDGSRPLP